MIDVIGVRFKPAGKVYYFDPDGMEVQPKENVIVETVRGIEYGEVVMGATPMPEKELILPLRKMLRLANENDSAQILINEQDEHKAFEICEEKIEKHKLEMSLLEVEYTFDRNKIIFYFTADGRVDFRELVKDLAGVFKTRIELRQVGVRDEAKLLGGLGSCGRVLCCHSFLGEFQPVSIKMAKDQNLSLNPSKISGLCGRLMCCLRYEMDAYSKTPFPDIDTVVTTPQGQGTTKRLCVVKELVTVKLEDGGIKDFPVKELTWKVEKAKPKKEQPFYDVEFNDDKKNNSLPSIENKNAKEENVKPKSQERLNRDDNSTERKNKPSKKQQISKEPIQKHRTKPKSKPKQKQTSLSENGQKKPEEQKVNTNKKKRRRRRPKNNNTNKPQEESNKQ